MPPQLLMQSPRRLAVIVTVAALLAAGLLGRPLATVSAATTQLDFGGAGIGQTVEQDHVFPLTAALSELPPETVLYEGGDATLDTFLALQGLTVPLTAGELYAEFGEITATFHLAHAFVIGTDFAAVGSDCATAAGSCTATLEFSPVDAGLRTDTLVSSISDLQLSGGGGLEPYLSYVQDGVATEVENQLAVDVSGTGAAESGGLQLIVTVEPEAAPCILLDAAALDFGTLSFSTESFQSGGTQAMNLTSCSSGDEAVYAEGTDATGDGNPPASWALSSVGGNPCATGLDLYGVSLSGDTGVGMPTFIQLSTVSTSWLVLGAEASAPTDVGVQMPCVGSSGAGQTMTSTVTLTATTP